MLVKRKDLNCAKMVLIIRKYIFDLICSSELRRITRRKLLKYCGVIIPTIIILGLAIGLALIFAVSDTNQREPDRIRTDISRWPNKNPRTKAPIWTLDATTLTTRLPPQVVAGGPQGQGRPGTTEGSWEPGNYQDTPGRVKTMDPNDRNNYVYTPNPKDRHTFVPGTPDGYGKSVGPPLVPPGSPQGQERPGTTQGSWRPGHVISTSNGLDGHGRPGAPDSYGKSVSRPQVPPGGPQGQGRPGTAEGSWEPGNYQDTPGRVKTMDPNDRNNYVDTPIPKDRHPFVPGTPDGYGKSVGPHLVPPGGPQGQGRPGTPGGSWRPGHVISTPSGVDGHGRPSTPDGYGKSVTHPQVPPGGSQAHGRPGAPGGSWPPGHVTSTSNGLDGHGRPGTPDGYGKSVTHPQVPPGGSQTHGRPGAAGGSWRPGHVTSTSNGLDGHGRPGTPDGYGKSVTHPQVPPGGSQAHGRPGAPGGSWRPGHVTSTSNGLDGHGRPGTPDGYGKSVSRPQVPPGGSQGHGRPGAPGGSWRPGHVTSTSNGLDGHGRPGTPDGYGISVSRPQVPPGGSQGHGGPGAPGGSWRPGHVTSASNGLDGHGRPDTPDGYGKSVTHPQVPPGGSQGHWRPGAPGGSWRPGHVTSTSNGLDGHGRPGTPDGYGISVSHPQVPPGGSQGHGRPGASGGSWPPSHVTSTSNGLDGHGRPGTPDGYGKSVTHPQVPPGGSQAHGRPGAPGGSWRPGHVTSTSNGLDGHGRPGTPDGYGKSVSRPQVPPGGSQGHGRPGAPGGSWRPGHVTSTSNGLDGHGRPGTPDGYGKSVSRPQVPPGGSQGHGRPGAPGGSWGAGHVISTLSSVDGHGRPGTPDGYGISVSHPQVPPGGSQGHGRPGAPGGSWRPGHVTSTSNGLDGHGRPGTPDGYGISVSHPQVPPGGSQGHGRPGAPGGSWRPGHVTSTSNGLDGHGRPGSPDGYGKSVTHPPVPPGGSQGHGRPGAPGGSWRPGHVTSTSNGLDGHGRPGTPDGYGKSVSRPQVPPGGSQGHGRPGAPGGSWGAGHVISTLSSVDGHGRPGTPDGYGISVSHPQVPPGGSQGHGRPGAPGGSWRPGHVTSTSNGLDGHGRPGSPDGYGKSVTHPPVPPGGSQGHGRPGAPGGSWRPGHVISTLSSVDGHGRPGTPDGYGISASHPQVPPGGSQGHGRPGASGGSWRPGHVTSTSNGLDGHGRPGTPDGYGISVSHPQVPPGGSQGHGRPGASGGSWPPSHVTSTSNGLDGHGRPGTPDGYGKSVTHPQVPPGGSQAHGRPGAPGGSWRPGHVTSTSNGLDGHGRPGTPDGYGKSVSRPQVPPGGSQGHGRPGAPGGSWRPGHVTSTSNGLDGHGRPGTPDGYGKSVSRPQVPPGGSQAHGRPGAPGGSWGAGHVISTLSSVDGHGRPGTPDGYGKSVSRPQVPPGGSQGHGRPGAPGGSWGPGTSYVKSTLSSIYGHGRPGTPDGYGKSVSRPQIPPGGSQAHGRPGAPAGSWGPGTSYVKSTLSSIYANGRPGTPDGYGQSVGRPQVPPDGPQGHGRPGSPGGSWAPGPAYSENSPISPVGGRPGRIETLDPNYRDNYIGTPNYKDQNPFYTFPQGHGRPGGPGNFGHWFGPPRFPPGGPQGHGRPGSPGGSWAPGPAYSENSPISPVGGRPGRIETLDPNYRDNYIGSPNYKDQNPFYTFPQGHGRPGGPGNFGHWFGPPRFPPGGPQGHGRPGSPGGSWAPGPAYSENSPISPVGGRPGRIETLDPNYRDNYIGSPNYKDRNPFYTFPQGHGRPGGPGNFGHWFGPPRFPPGGPQGHGRPGSPGGSWAPGPAYSENSPISPVGGRPGRIETLDPNYRDNYIGSPNYKDRNPFYTFPQGHGRPGRPGIPGNYGQGFGPPRFPPGGPQGHGRPGSPGGSWAPGPAYSENSPISPVGGRPGRIETLDPNYRDNYIGSPNYKDRNPFYTFPQGHGRPGGPGNFGHWFGPPRFPPGGPQGHGRPGSPGGSWAPGPAYSENSPISPVGGRPGRIETLDPNYRDNYIGSPNYKDRNPFYTFPQGHGRPGRPGIPGNYGQGFGPPRFPPGGPQGHGRPGSPGGSWAPGPAYSENSPISPVGGRPGRIETLDPNYRDNYIGSPNYKDQNPFYTFPQGPWRPGRPGIPGNYGQGFGPPRFPPGGPQGQGRPGAPGGSWAPGPSYSENSPIEPVGDRPGIFSALDPNDKHSYIHTPHPNDQNFYDSSSHYTYTHQYGSDYYAALETTTWFPCWFPPDSEDYPSDYSYEESDGHGKSVGPPQNPPGGPQGQGRPGTPEGLLGPGTSHVKSKPSHLDGHGRPGIPGNNGQWFGFPQFPPGGPQGHGRPGAPEGWAPGPSDSDISPIQPVGGRPGRIETLDPNYRDNYIGTPNYVMPGPSNQQQLPKDPYPSNYFDYDWIFNPWL